MGGTAKDAKGLAAAGVDSVALYLGVAKPAQANACWDAGMGCFGVTLDNAWNGDMAVSQAKALGFPAGTTLFLDMEADTVNNSKAPEIIDKVNAWADKVAAAGYLPGLYVGVPQMLTSTELHKLRVYRYWKGMGRTVDRNNQLAEPTNGWCLFQMFPSVFAGGVWVDHNMVGQDYKTRVPVVAYK